MLRVISAVVLLLATCWQPTVANAGFLDVGKTRMFHGGWQNLQNWLLTRLPDGRVAIIEYDGKSVTGNGSTHCSQYPTDVKCGGRTWRNRPWYGLGVTHDGTDYLEIDFTPFYSAGGWGCTTSTPGCNSGQLNDYYAVKLYQPYPGLPIQIDIKWPGGPGWSIGGTEVYFTYNSEPVPVYSSQWCYRGSMCSGTNYCTNDNVGAVGWPLEFHTVWKNVTNRPSLTFILSPDGGEPTELLQGTYDPNANGGYSIGTMIGSNITPCNSLATEVGLCWTPTNTIRCDPSLPVGTCKIKPQGYCAANYDASPAIADWWCNNGPFSAPDKVEACSELSTCPSSGCPPVPLDDCNVTLVPHGQAKKITTASYPAGRDDYLVNAQEGPCQ